MGYELHEMDCRLAMSMLMESDSVDSIVCDPPYGLSREPDMMEVLRHWIAGDDYTHTGNGFMGKSWDSFVPGPSVWREAYRVLKPGGYLVAFFGTRTYDLGVLALRLAGFEIRDQLAWVFGSGFPKSLDVSKAIEKSRREDIEPTRRVCRFIRAGMDSKSLKSKHLVHLFDDCDPRLIDHWAARDSDSQPSLPTPLQWDILVDALNLAEHDDFAFIAIEWARLNARKGDVGDSFKARPVIGQGHRVRAESIVQIAGLSDGAYDLTAPATDAAKQWQGWGTALKPAYEPIVLARKPLSERTVAANVLAHGTGAINIDGCRIGDGADKGIWPETNRRHADVAYTLQPVQTDTTVGRWPANLCHDGSDEVLTGFPTTTSGKMRAAQDGPGSACYGTYGGNATSVDTLGDTGSAARFFYCPKASKADRNEGCSNLPIGTSDPYAEHRGRRMPDGSERFDGQPASVGANIHPTVKPTDLMRWLCRLVTQPGGTVFDPFAGSGSTGKAALLEGFRFVGCEMMPEYAAIAHARLTQALAAVPAPSTRPAPAHG